MTRDELLKTAKPIIFNTEMVRAILDGRKTVARRVIKPANTIKANIMGGYRQGDGLWINNYDNGGEIAESIKDYSVSPCWQRMDDYIKKYVPNVGDVLYVRETWGRQTRHGGIFTVYKADNLNAKNYDTNASGSYETGNVKWLPSVHMRKEAARIFLKITDVRAERLQDITEEQATREGAECRTHPCIVGAGKSHVQGFGYLWDDFCKKQYSWSVNPWVWVIEFEVLEAVR